MIIIPLNKPESARICRMVGNFEIGTDINGRECPVSDHKDIAGKVALNSICITGGNIYFDENSSGKIGKKTLEAHGIDALDLPDNVRRFTL